MSAEAHLFHGAAFLTSASRLDQCPQDVGREVAFAGRSNAGKSSAINTLANNGKLARTSRTPGRTQLLNFFTWGDQSLRLVDLPGYGYARVPEATKLRWQQQMEGYLEARRSLCGLVLVSDSRHPLKEFDRMILRWCVTAEMPLHVLLTKSDKLKRGAAQSTLREVAQVVAGSLGDRGSVQLYSALKRSGVADLEQRLASWLGMAAV